MDLLTLRRRLLSLLAKEFEAYLPQFESRTSDYQVVVYACRDLEDWIKYKWATTNHRRVYKRLENTLECKPKDFRVFLNFWMGRWLEKWRERVKVLSNKRKLPPKVLENIRKAKKIYRGMEHGKELKKMVTQKLIGQGEICLAQVIAENLIIEEIAKRSRSLEGDVQLMMVTPLDIYNSLSPRISRLHEEKGPLVYLKIKPHMF
jgi:hypothetical protein